MKYVALKPLPHGQQPGELFEEPDAIGKILILAGAARAATAEDEPKSEEIAASRRRYRRRDLTAAS